MILREGQEVCKGHPASALPKISPDTRMKHQKKPIPGMISPRIPKQAIRVQYGRICPGSGGS